MSSRFLSPVTNFFKQTFLEHEPEGMDQNPSANRQGEERGSRKSEERTGGRGEEEENGGAKGTRKTAKEGQHSKEVRRGRGEQEASASRRERARQYVSGCLRLTVATFLCVGGIGHGDWISSPAYCAFGWRCVLGAMRGVEITDTLYDIERGRRAAPTCMKVGYGLGNLYICTFASIAPHEYITRTQYVFKQDTNHLDSEGEM